jgi:predicted glycosyltransferase
LRIWFDVLTPKQILFFKPVIDSLERTGFQVLATSRRYRELEPLAKLHGLELSFVGERGGKEKAEQLRASIHRMEDLIPLVQRFEPNIAVSVASTDCARIAFGLGIKHVAVNDSPHSLVAGKLSLPLSHLLLTPWIIPYEAWSVFGLDRRRITRYRALDPAAWLKRQTEMKTSLIIDRSKDTILVRLEESQAPYMSGTDSTWGERLVSSLVKQFRGLNIILLCRYDDQLRRFKERFGSSCTIPEEVVDGSSLISQSSVFVGMGGTMTTEAALSGVPTISAFQGELYTEKYLMSKRLLQKSLEIGEITKIVGASLDKSFRQKTMTRAKALLDWMEDPVEKIVHTLAKVPLS